MEHKANKYLPMRNLKDMRIKCRLTLEELAEKCELHLNTLSNYETGKHTPRIENLKKVAKALNCELKDIL